jgi:hypothetical protein
VKAGSTAVFYINDDALEVIKSGNATFSGHNTASQFFDVPGGETGTNSGTAVDTNVVRVLDSGASSYSTTEPASTPWAEIPVVTASTTGEISLTTHSKTAGTVNLSVASGVGSSTVVSFKYHTADSWDGQNTDNRRAKVVSTSDSQGEWITISEVAAIGSSTSNPTSKIFLGSILLSDSAATQGGSGNGVWVQDGDTVTVTYVDSNGLTVDSNTIIVDAVVPTITNILPATGTITGLQKPTIQFDITDLGSGVPSVRASAFTILVNTSIIDVGIPAFLPIANGFQVIFTHPNNWIGVGGLGAVDGTPLTWTMTATDNAGNTKTVTSLLTIDITKPTVSSAKSGVGYDLAKEKETTGQTNSVRVTFTENIDPSTVSPSDFTVGGVTPTAAVVGTKGDAKKSVYLTVGTLAPNAKPDVVVTGGINDSAGNSVDTSASILTNKASASDGLNPTITSVVSKALAVKDDKVKITVTSNEQLGTTGLIVSIIGPDGSTANKTLSTTAPSDPLIREGETTIPSGAAVTGMYGVSIQATDLGTNAANNLTKVAGESVATSKVVASGANTVITVAKGPIGDMNFDGVLDGSDIQNLKTAAGAAISSGLITDVDASARTITLLTTSLAVGTAVTVDYWYPATETFEVDNSAPVIVSTLLFNTADGASTVNRTPFISIKWDEDEYPGDSHTIVSMTKALLKAPDGTETDILALLSTTDSKTYFYRPVDNMAIGEYTLTVKSKDTAGNETSDVAAKIEIKEKTKTKIALIPGWNLISIPGTPSDTAINVVITPPEINTVLSFDASTAGGWLTAIRDTESGMLVGTLTDITASRAYWVHTSNDSPIEVDIAGVEAGATQLPPALSLAKGWNLVPAVSLDPSFTSVDADVYLSGLKWSKGYSYDRKLGRFSSFTPQTAGTADTCQTEGVTGGTIGDCIDSGFGYWIYLTESGVLIP